EEPPKPPLPEAPRAAPAAPAAQLAPAEAEATPSAARAVGPLSPAVRRLLAEHDLDPTLVPASGKGGRLTKEDVLAYLERSARPVRIEVPAAPTPSAPLAEGEERVPMSPIRRRIAERLVQAQRTAAILTTFNEIDMTEVIALRAEHKERFQKQHGIGLGFMSFFARDGKLKLDDLAGGTFTISNGGGYGSLLSTPILNPPQSAILGMHKIEKRPVVVEEQIAIRPMMYVAVSYDHRLVDGEQAVTFLVRVKERLEDPERLLLDV